MIQIRIAHPNPVITVPPNLKFARFMIFALIASFVFKFTYLENLILGLCIGLVIVTEIINTCIEKICDFMSPETDERIKLIKDMSAGAVLFAALVSLILGLMMVINHL